MSAFTTTVTCGTSYATLGFPILFNGQIWPDSASLVQIKDPSGNVTILDGTKSEFMTFTAPISLDTLQVRGNGGAAGQVLKLAGNSQ